MIDVTDYQEFQSKNYEGKAIGQLISKQGITWHSKNKKSDGKADQMAGSIFIEQRINNLPQGKFSIRFRKQNSLEERTVSARFIVK